MTDEKRNDVALEIEELLKDVQAEAPMTKGCSICKVPDEIRKLNDDDYTPKIVSIGPFHHHNRSLQKMESQKLIYFKEFLKRSKTNLDSLVSRVEELELEVRCCYSENIEYEKKDFVKMILVDAGFIIEFFCQFFVGTWGDPKRDDAGQLKWWWLKKIIIMDLHLLENQLPFFFLEELYNLAIPTPQSGHLSTFSQLSSSVLGRRDVPASTPILHFTDVFRNSTWQPSRRQYQMTELILHTFPSATELHEIGAKLMVDESSMSLLDLQFSGGILQNPPLIVDGMTEKLFLNTIALEQCDYPHKQYITDYIFLLSCLIKTDEDADILIKNGIIANYLGHSNNVTRLFHSLAKSTRVTHSSYSELCKELHVFCKNREARMVTILK